LAGKKLTDNLSQKRQDDRNRRKAVEDKGENLDENMNKTNDPTKIQYSWNDNVSGYVDKSKLYKDASGNVVSQQINGGQYLGSNGQGQKNASSATHVWDNDLQSYVALNKQGDKENAILEDQGAIVNRYGDFEKEGKKYRRRNSEDNTYYEVNSAGKFVDEKGKETGDIKEMQKAKSAILPFKSIKEMKHTGFYDGYMTERTRSMGLAEAAEQEKIKEAQKQYGHLSGDEAANLMTVEKNDTNRMALAMVAASKGGVKNAEKANTVKDILRGNSGLLKEYNDKMNENHILVNNTNKDGSLDEATINRMISTGKAKWSEQDTKEISKIPKAINLMSKQLAGKFQATLDSMNRTAQDKKYLVSALESNITERGFEGDDNQIRKAAAYFSGNFPDAYKDQQGNVNNNKMGEAIRQISKGEIFGNLTDATIADPDFKEQFVQNVTVNQLNAAARSTDVDEVKMDQFMNIIDSSSHTLASDLKTKIKDNSYLKSYAKRGW